MRRIVLALFTSLLMTALPVFAQSEAPVLCSSRMKALEKAKCMAEQHRQIMASFSSSSPKPAASAIDLPPVRSCSRMNGKEKAACMVLQRQDVLKQIAAMPPTPPPPQVINNPHQNCYRIADTTQRLTCLNGQNPRHASSSSSSSL